MRFTLRGAHLVDVTQDIPNGDITIDGIQIGGIGYFPESQGRVIEAADAIVMPGFIDVHTHGGGGYNLHTADVDEIRNYTRWVATTGVTSFLIGVVGVVNALPEAQLRAAVEAVEDTAGVAVKQSRDKFVGDVRAEPLGIHLEGPYINVLRKGAHPPSWLREPDAAETEHILALTNGSLRLITLAPELPGAADMIQRLVRAGVTVSLGHSDATYEQAQEAIKLGITHMTHCFNAMRSIHHREPGPLAAVVQAAHVRGELIADGEHVHPAAMDMLVRMLGPRRTVVITDAQAGAGLNEDAVFEFAGQPLHVLCGAARLADGTLAGSVLTMDQALRNMLVMTNASLQEAVGMLTFNPACAAGASERKGRLQAGYDADLLIFNRDLSLQATICRGRLAFATDEWRARLS